MPENPSESELDRRGAALYAEYVEGVRDFSNRQISDLRLLDIKFEEVDFTASEFENCVFGNVIFDKGTFDGACFTRCNVNGSSFQYVKMREAKFNTTVFSRVDFLLGNLQGTKFINCALTDSYLGQADLCDCDLSGGVFSGTWFAMTNLNGSILVGADFENANIQSFNAINSDTLQMNAGLLRQTLGRRAQLEELLLSVDDVAKTKLAASLAKDATDKGYETLPIEEIPAALERIDHMYDHLRRFLLASGCDVKEVLMMDQAVDKTKPEYPRVFISYSSVDEEIARHLYSVLSEFGVDVWFAPESMRGGRKIHEQLEEAIAERDKIILILSEASMGSPWVKSELEWAADREINAGEQILFPIRVVSFEAIREWELFDADLGRDVAKYVRQYFVPDFSAWEDATTLARMTERLLEDLRHSFSS